MLSGECVASVNTILSLLKRKTYREPLAYSVRCSSPGSLDKPKVVGVKIGAIEYDAGKLR